MERMAEIRRIILEKLCRRLAQEHGLRAMEKGDTEMFDRILALWIDLQSAIHLREGRDPKQDGCTPWNCADKGVSDAWNALTNPKNLHALESLYCQLPEGPQMELARKALQVCRDRSAPMSPGSDSERREGEKP
jgi:hypothetical protein